MSVISMLTANPLLSAALLLTLALLAAEAWLVRCALRNAQRKSRK